MDENGFTCDFKLVDSNIEMIKYICVSVGQSWNFFYFKVSVMFVKVQI